MYDERFTITYHHTTKDGFKIYHLQDMSREEYNDGRCIIFASKEWCEKMKIDRIKELQNGTQLTFDLGDD